MIQLSLRYLKQDDAVAGSSIREALQHSAVDTNRDSFSTRLVYLSAVLENEDGPNILLFGGILRKIVLDLEVMVVFLETVACRDL